MDRYIKKKDLDPLETYIPAILAAKDQLVESMALLDSASNAPEARRLLREGKSAQYLTTPKPDIRHMSNATGIGCALHNLDRIEQELNNQSAGPFTGLRDNIRVVGLYAE
eukprot:scaffold118623_cov47-Prasinocladus_malaysianus.AAC.1